MEKIKKIIALSSDLTFSQLNAIDSQLIDLLSDFDSPSVDDLLNFLADRVFVFIKTNCNDFYVLDLENHDPEDYDLTDPKKLLDQVDDGFTIREFCNLLAQLKLARSIRNTISDHVINEFTGILTFGELVING